MMENVFAVLAFVAGLFCVYAVVGLALPRLPLIGTRKRAAMLTLAAFAAFVIAVTTAMALEPPEQRAAREARNAEQPTHRLAVVPEAEATSAVARALDSDNKLGVRATALKVKPNTKGAGTFVYVEQTRFFGVERPLVWLFLDGTAYPLNSPSKMLTPTLPWPREAPEATWNATSLSPYSATEALELVYGSAR